jgi:hypothetical protein
VLAPAPGEPGRLRPATVADRATFEEPRAVPVGIRDVLVGGVPVVREERVTGARPGRLVRDRPLGADVRRHRANSGIGYETVRALRADGRARGHGLPRPRARRGRRAALARETGNARLELEVADLSSQARCARSPTACVALATGSSARQQRGHLVVVAARDRRRHRADVGDQPARVLPAHRAPAAAARTQRARADRHRRLRPRARPRPRRRRVPARPYDGVARTRRASRRTGMWTWALARRLDGTGVTANALHRAG